MDTKLESICPRRVGLQPKKDSVASFLLGLQPFQVCVQLVLGNAFPLVKLRDAPANFLIIDLTVGH